MSVQAILAAIRASGEAQVKQIEAAAREELAQHLAEAQRLRQESSKATLVPGAAERARIMSRARLKAQRILSDAREGLIDEAIDQARQHLASIRNDPIYPVILRQLTEEALADLQGSLQEAETPKLEADPRDQDVLESILSDMDLELQVSYELDGWGGIIAKRNDGQGVVVNTLEGRLTRAMPYLRQCLGDIIDEGRPESSVDQFKLPSKV